MEPELLEEYPPYSPIDLGPNRRADYEALPDTPRCELIRGRLYLSPSPTSLHQTVASLLWNYLRALGRATGGRVFLAPLDTILADHSVVQPDVVYLTSGKRELIGERIEGVPDLVAEVASPKSMRINRGEKLRIYAEAGVAEYWIADASERLIEFLVLREGNYVVYLPEGSTYRSAVFPEIQIDLEAFWREVDEELVVG
ncbi:MAG: Uma2 family endonuclease [Acidobacteriota bacterium]